MKTILDVSSIVYGGHHGSPDYRISGFPVGGLRKIFGIINSEVEVSDIFLCLDGGATIKKELLPEYKAGRVPQYSILAQLDLFEEILDECNIPYYKKEGYEADDFICSLVHFCSQIGDNERIVIYTDDRDMSCCVSDNVEIHGVTSNGVNITKENYSSRVVTGSKIPYNTILLHKLMFGDKSDNYGGLKIPGLNFDALCYEYLQMITPFFESGAFSSSAYMDVNIFNAVVDELSLNLSAEQRDEIKKHAKIVFPQLMDVTRNGMEAFLAEANTAGKPLFELEEEHLKCLSEKTLNHKKFDHYCNMLRLNRCRFGRWVSSPPELEDAFKSDLALRAKELSSGAMAVSRYRKRKMVQASSTTLQNMELPI